MSSRSRASLSVYTVLWPCTSTSTLRRFSKRRRLQLLARNVPIQSSKGCLIHLMTRGQFEACGVQLLSTTISVKMLPESRGEMLSFGWRVPIRCWYIVVGTSSTDCMRLGCCGPSAGTGTPSLRQNLSNARCIDSINCDQRDRWSRNLDRSSWW